MSYLIIDIETIPDQSIVNIPDLVPFKPGNLKNVDKIKEKEQQYQGSEDQVKKMSLDPHLCQIISLCMYSSISKERPNYLIKENSLPSNDGYIIPKPQEKHPAIKTETHPEKTMLLSFWEQAKKHYLLVGHNILSFDLRVIIARSMYLDINPSKILNLKKYQVAPIFDTMQVLGNWESSQYKSLAWWAKRLKFDYKETSGSQIYQWFKEKDFNAIDKHCKKDVGLTLELYKRIKDWY